MRLPGRRVVLADPGLTEAEFIGPAKLLEVPLMAVEKTALGRVRGHGEESVVHARILRRFFRTGAPRIRGARPDRSSAQGPDALHFPRRFPSKGVRHEG